MYVSVDYLHDVYHSIMGQLVLSVLSTSMMSIIVSWVYMYVSVDYLHDVYHSIMGLHVCQCW